MHTHSTERRQGEVGRGFRSAFVVARRRVPTQPILSKSGEAFRLDLTCPVCAACMQPFFAFAFLAVRTERSLRSLSPPPRPPRPPDARGSEIALHRFVTTAVTSSIVTEARKKGEGMRARSLRDKAQTQAKCASGLAMLHGLCDTLSSCASVSFPLSASTAKLAIVLLS